MADGDARLSCINAEFAELLDGEKLGPDEVAVAAGRRAREAVDVGYTALKFDLDTANRPFAPHMIGGPLALAATTMSPSPC